VKFVEISFDDEFIDCSPCFLLPALMDLIMVHMVLVQKREIFYITMLWL
jgi:hypothetical protein